MTNVICVFYTSCFIVEPRILTGRLDLFTWERCIFSLWRSRPNAFAFKTEYNISASVPRHDPYDLAWPSLWSVVGTDIPLITSGHLPRTLLTFRTFDSSPSSGCRSAVGWQPSRLRPSVNPSTVICLEASDAVDETVHPSLTDKLVTASQVSVGIRVAICSSL